RSQLTTCMTTRMIDLPMTDAEVTVFALRYQSYKSLYSAYHDQVQQHHPYTDRFASLRASLRLRDHVQDWLENTVQGSELEQYVTRTQRVVEGYRGNKLVTRTSFAGVCVLTEIVATTRNAHE
ncbi:MAG: hypothetical protein CMF61_07870, partial [Magnetococcales bacterium]|nr:hypothetical protein [Magnetococcales bacterium]